MVLIPDFHTYYAMLTLIEYGVIALLTLGTGLGSAYIVYLVIKPRLQASIRGYLPAITKSIKRSMGEMVSEATEGLDLGAIAGQLGGAEGDSGGLGQIAGLLGKGGGGFGELLKILGPLMGKGKEGGGSSGW